MRIESPAATLASGVAVVLSGFSLWDTSLQDSDLRIFVPPAIYYAGHQPGTTMEVLKIPVTLVNEGAQTGTVLSLNLAVSDPKTGQAKNFYSASVVPETGAPVPFTPIVLAGHTSKSAILLFYTRGSAEKAEQIVAGAGSYQFTLALDEAKSSDSGPLSLLGSKSGGTTITFTRDLPAYDARLDAMPLYAPDWQSAVSGESK
jgi:hypothetical protein